MIVRPAKDVCKKLTFVNSAQSLNAETSMAVTELGIVTEVRLEQFSNANIPIFMSPGVNVTEVRDEQLVNAPEPMDVTEPGIVIEVRRVENSNAYTPIYVSPLINVTEVI